MGRIIGIDLGTTYSVVSVFNHRTDRFEIIPQRDGSSTLPSVVAYINREIVVGVGAKRNRVLDPDGTVAEFKRHMGEPLTVDGRVQTSAKGEPLPWQIDFAGKPHSPEMLSAYVLKELKLLAEEYLGEAVEGAVITVPAYFKEVQRRATKTAGTLAGLDVKLLLSEPTAAAISFGLTSADDEDEDEDELETKRVLVYDLGGGTFDVSVIEIIDGNIQVLGVGGDHKLGGVDFDQAIIDILLDHVRDTHGVDLRRTDGLDPATEGAYLQARQRIVDEAETAKIGLSNTQSVSVNMPFLLVLPTCQITVDLTIQRDDFLLRIGLLLKRTLETVDQTLADVSLSKDDIDDVLLVGGSTKIPKVRRMLKRHFGRPPRSDINPGECVALGAAMMTLQYQSSEGLSPEVEERIEELLQEQGDVIDVTGHSLGVAEGAEGNMSVLIPRNTAIPCVEKQIYMTAHDLQQTVQVVVFQGEDPKVANNTKLAQFEITDLQPLPAGHVKIEIEFELTLDGVLEVRATDVNRGEQKTCTVTYDGSVTANPDDLVEMAASKKAAAGGPAGIPESMRATWERAKRLASTVPAIADAMKAYQQAVAGGDADDVEDARDALEDLILEHMEAA